MDSFYGDPSSPHATPPEVRKWNWGAFFLTWIWGIGNSVWIAFLSFIPVVNLVMPFVLGAKGSQWAWKAKQWESVEHFQRVQRKWARWGLIIFLISVVIAVIGVGASVWLTDSLMNNTQMITPDINVDPSLETPSLDAPLPESDMGTY
jgi:hypothetical protein